MKKSRILIVEDERILSKDLVRCVEDREHEVLSVCHSGEEAVRLAAELSPDLVLMDIVLDGTMDGIEAAEIIRRKVGSAVVYLTAHPEEDIFRRAKITDPSAFLTKPISPTDLTRTMEMALHKREMEQKLKESEQRLELAIKGAGLGMWDWNIWSGQIEVNDLWLRTMEYHKDGAPLTLSDWDYLFHSDDRRIARRKVIEHLKGKTSNYECEARIRAGTGQWKWVLIRGAVSRRSPNGRALRVTGTCLDITDKKQAEQALIESENRYRTLFELSPHGIILYIDEKVALMNRASAQALGVEDPSRLKGRSVYEIVAPDYHELAKERLKSLTFDGAIVEPAIQQYVRMDGTLAWVESSASSFHVFDQLAVLSMFREITSEVQARQALAHHEEKHRNIVSSIEEGYYELALDGTITFCNDSLTRLLSVPLSQLLGEKFSSFFEADASEQVNRTFNEALESGAPVRSAIWSFTKTDGTTGLLEVSVSLVRDSSGAPNGFCGICRDFTEHKKSEDLMLRSARLEAIAELATGVAHNFNNLLQIIMTASHLASSNIETGNINQAKESLKIVNESSASGAETVKRLQEFANVRANGPSKASEIFDLSGTAVHALEMSRSICLPRSGSPVQPISINSDLEDNCLIAGNQSEIFQVIINLIKNGVEAISAQGEVTLRTYKKGGEVHLEVMDTGEGIPEESASKVFEPFWTTKCGHGTGLGLAGSYGIVQSHQGEISYEPRQPHGAIFRVTIPSAEQPVVSKVESSAEPLAQYLTIMLVDDMPLVLEQLREGFENLGHRIITSETGEDALAKLEEVIPDAVVCDLGLPGVNGWQVGKEFKELCEARSVKKPPFIILTGWAGQIESDEKIAQCGVDSIMEKPAQVRVLIRTISELVGNSEEKD
jgi:PAS domain S-box-containing protein